MWSTAPKPTAVKPLSVQTQVVLDHFKGDKFAMLQAWYGYAKQLEQVKGDELQIRNAVVEVFFPETIEGTRDLEVGGGYTLKDKQPYNYKLDPDKTAGAQERMAELGEAAEVIAERLVKWKPELSITEYRALQKLSDEGTPAQKKMANQILAIVEHVLTITPGQAALEIVPPKATKL